MSSFEPNKRHLRKLLIYFFNLKKSAAKAHRLLVETYGEAALIYVNIQIISICGRKFSIHSRNKFLQTFYAERSEKSY